MLVSRSGKDIIQHLFKAERSLNKEIKLNSPSKNLVVKILNDSEGLNLTLFNSKKEIIELDLKGFVFESELDFNNYEVTKTSKSSENEIGR